MSNFRELTVWQDGMVLVRGIYTVTQDHFPDTERYGLTSQMRRCAISIPSNIAEGSNRRTTRDYISFLYNARGSCAELETQIELSNMLGYISENSRIEFNNSVVSINRRLSSLIASLERKLDASPSPIPHPPSTGPEA